MSDEDVPHGAGPDDAMAAEFDTVAEWTADAALALGPDHSVPAGCRGSAQPAGFDWLLDRLQLRAGDLLLDVGAGVGGPAAYAAQQRGVRPVLVEPALGACRAAARLFALPVTCGDAAALPIADAVVGAVWSLGVLCTTDDHTRVLRETARVLRPGGRAGLLVFVSQVSHPAGEPAGNDFPTRPRLLAALSAAGLRLLDETDQDALPPLPDSWADRAGAVEAEVKRRHGHDPAWRAAQEESDAVGALIKAGTVRGVLLVVERPGAAG